MTNPFWGTDPVVRRNAELIGRESAFRDMDRHVRRGRNVAVMGVEGVGKSSFLNCFFNYPYRTRMARENRVLIRITDFPTDRNANDIYQYLTDGVVSSLDVFDNPETEDEYLRLFELVKRKCEEVQNAASRFQQVCECLEREDYRIMFVIDGFERFVFSPDITMEHHSFLNNIISKNISFIVSTNYDFNQDSLPSTISGSFFLQKFAGNEITLEGFSKEDCEYFLIDGGFEEDEIEQLMILTGGIPLLLRIAAAHRFQQKMAGNRDQWDEVLYATLEDPNVKRTLRRWCRWLSPSYVDVINELIKLGPGAHCFDDSTLKSAAVALAGRGFLTHPVSEHSGKMDLDYFQFNSLLLKKYCMDNPVHAEDPNDIYKRVGRPQENQELMEKASVISFDDEKLLKQYHLSKSELTGYSDDVQKLIKTAIYVDQTLLGQDLPDHSPAFIEFAKALEVHINETLIPVAQAICPSFLVNDTELSQMTWMTLGQTVKMMNRNADRFTKFTDYAGAYCKAKGMGGFTGQWWESVRRDLSSSAGSQNESIADIRNDMAHKELIPAAQGELLLKMLFSGDKCLFTRCQNLYEAAKQKKIL